jgi:hypothetical protein
MLFFSHPDFTVGFGITPNQPNDYHVFYPLHVCQSGRGLYRRSGITPCPEEFFLFNFVYKVIITLSSWFSKRFFKMFRCVTGWTNIMS